LASGSALRGIPFFAGLSDEGIAALERAVQIRRFGKNEVILLEEQTADHMYLVYSGKVKAVKVSEDGRENILAIHEEGDYFGEMALQTGRRRQPSSPWKRLCSL
jgi:CRP/FNR family transcriptional regulator